MTVRVVIRPLLRARIFHLSAINTKTIRGAKVDSNPPPRARRPRTRGRSIRSNTRTHRLGVTPREAMTTTQASELPRFPVVAVMGNGRIAARTTDPTAASVAGSHTTSLSPAGSRTLDLYPGWVLPAFPAGGEVPTIFVLLLLT